MINTRRRHLLFAAIILACSYGVLGIREETNGFAGVAGE